MIIESNKWHVNIIDNEGVKEILIAKTECKKAEVTNHSKKAIVRKQK